MDEEETHSIFHWKAIIWDCKSATAARLRGQKNCFAYITETWE